MTFEYFKGREDHLYEILINHSADSGVTTLFDSMQSKKQARSPAVASQAAAPPASSARTDLSVWRPWAGSSLEATTHPQML